MPFDLNAGLAMTGRNPPLARHPRILVFDSGVGGLSVHAELARMLPQASFIYAADDAAFPYGAWDEDRLVDRIVDVIDALIAEHAPDLVVIACNTASTLVLPVLRARFAIPFVGTVPAIKPAAALSRSRMISVLATPGTVARDYTRTLVANFAAGCDVTLVGSAHLAGLAERVLTGEASMPDDLDAAIMREIAPCFRMSDTGARTDVVTLSCTHYPLLIAWLERLAPWPVTWIDPAPAIARRVASLVGAAPETGQAEPAKAVFTGSGGDNPRLRAALQRRGFCDVTQVRALKNATAH